MCKQIHAKIQRSRKGREETLTNYNRAKNSIVENIKSERERERVHHFSIVANT